MSTDLAGGAQASEYPAPRPNLLAFVSPTTVRFVVLIGALLSTGLFLGTWVHNTSPIGQEWLDQVRDCRQRAAAAHPGDWQAQSALERPCLAAVESRRFAFAVGGAVITLSAGLAVMLVAPIVIERRRRLRRADPRMASVIDRFRELSQEAGLAQAPDLMVGPATSRDAFSYGIPRRYRVAVPPAILVRWRDRSTFDPVMRHELAHIHHHDVPLAWLARSTWMVVLPLLAVPIVGSLVRTDLSLLGSYVWRAVLLASVTLVAAAALLRSREFDADLRAGSSPTQLDDLMTVLIRITPPNYSRSRRLLTYHPTATERLDTLKHPQALASVSFVDGLTPAFLLGLTLPLVASASAIVAPGLSNVLATVLIGSLLGAVLGLGLWRQSLVRRIVGGDSSAVPATLGVAVGFALGTFASLGQTAVGIGGGYQHLAANLVLPIALCGATLLTAGIGEVFAEAAGMFRRPGSAWITCVLVSGTIFACALGAGRMLAIFLDNAGWQAASLILTGSLNSRLQATVALALAVVTVIMLVGARRRWDVPTWAVGGTTQPSHEALRPSLLGSLAVGVSAGMLAGLVIIGNRLIAGPAGTEAEIAARVDLLTWIIATSAVAATLALAMFQPVRGLGVALIASPVASLTTALCFLGLNTALGGYLSLGFVEAATRPGFALGFLGTIAAAALALLLQWRRPKDQSGAALFVVAAILAGLLSLGVIACRTAIIQTTPPTWSNIDVVPRGLYVELVARPLLEGRVAHDQAWRKLQAEQPSNDVAARRVRDEIVPLAQGLRDTAGTVKLDDPEVEEVHAHAIEGAQLQVDAFTELAVALDTDDRERLDQASALLQKSGAQWEAWATGVQNL